jgi:endonuclease/exonuclease/phosphatase family metal-dependent hydrolase
MAMLVALGSGVLAACAKPTSSTAGTIRVMTQNLYLGANLQPLLGATGPDLVTRAAAVYAHMHQVDFPVRAQALARLIAGEHPDVVGLQEVARWQKLRVDMGGSTTVVETVDYLPILLAALRDHRLSYRAVAEDTEFSNVDRPLPITLDGRTTATFTDRDVILVRTDVPASQVRAAHPTSRQFKAKITAPAPGGGTVAIPRGWSSTDVTVRGASFRIANTHLEASSPRGVCVQGAPSLQPPYVRNQQAAELAAALRTSPLPVILLGDLNALPTEGCDALPILLHAGLANAWAEAMPGLPANTAGQTDDLNNVPSRLNHQVDYVLDSRAGAAPIPFTGTVVGGALADRTPSGLWPSDHAGMALSLHRTK